MSDSKRLPILVWVGPLLIGLAGLYRVTQSPSFGLYRAVDMVQILASGMCFGAVMAIVILKFRLSRR